MLRRIAVFEHRLSRDPNERLTRCARAIDNRAGLDLLSVRGAPGVVTLTRASLSGDPSALTAPRFNAETFQRSEGGLGVGVFDEDDPILVPYHAAAVRPDAVELQLAQNRRDFVVRQSLKIDAHRRFTRDT